MTKAHRMSYDQAPVAAQVSRGPRPELSERGCVRKANRRGDDARLSDFSHRLFRPLRWLDAPFPRLSLRDAFAAGIVCLLALALCGCGTSKTDGLPAGRPFVFGQDTFAYANELVWDYDIDPAMGKAVHRPRQTPAEYTHHCFVMARAARQFFLHAQFEPSLPRARDETYRRLIRMVIARTPREESPVRERIIIPGYSNLCQFSRDHERTLKAECGGAWQSYFQRGHWRMVLPFTRSHQGRMAEQLAAALLRLEAPVVHVVNFPSLSINHVLVLYEVEEARDEMHFSAYDPNVPTQPARLTFHRASRHFSLPVNGYFVGGPVDVYEVYHAWNY